MALPLLDNYRALLFEQKKWQEVSFNNQLSASELCWNLASSLATIICSDTPKTSKAQLQVVKTVPDVRVKYPNLHFCLQCETFWRPTGNDNTFNASWQWFSPSICKSVTRLMRKSSTRLLACRGAKTGKGKSQESLLCLPFKKWLMPFPACWRQITLLLLKQSVC